MKIAIFAAIGAKNLGDELILKNEIQYFKHVYGKKTKIKVFTYDISSHFITGSKIKYLEYFPFNSKKIHNIIRNIKNFSNFIETVIESDLVVIGGGGIFFDNEGKNVGNPLNIWRFRARIFKLFHKKVRFHAVGLHIKNNENLPKIKSIFSIKNSEIKVRDSYSKKLLKKVGIDADIIADPVFSDAGNITKILDKNYCLDSIKPRQFTLTHLKGYNFKYKKIGIAFRSGYFWNDDESMCELIEYILKEKGEIILIPHSFHQKDIDSNDYIFLKKYSKKYNLPICKNMGESYVQYKDKQIDICLGMRLHSMILSQVYKIPFMAFSYSKKTDEILNIIEKGNKIK